MLDEHADGGGISVDAMDGGDAGDTRDAGDATDAGGGLVDAGGQPGDAGEGEPLYFSGDFSDVTLKPINASGAIYFETGWEDFRNHPFITNLYINPITDGRTLPYVDARIDPSFDSGRPSLYGQIINDDPDRTATSRFQMSIAFAESANLIVHHTSHRMYLHPDIEHLRNYSDRITWFTLFESWLERDNAMSGNVAGSARWSMSLRKDAGAGQPIYWHISSELMQPAEVEFDDLWAPVSNKLVPVPFGQWFTMDLYIKQGMGTAGKVRVTITPDGGSPQVVFDINDTTAYPGRPDLFRKSWQPFKIYLNDLYLDWMAAAGKKLAVYYNDFKWYVK